MWAADETDLSHARKRKMHAPDHLIIVYTPRRPVKITVIITPRHISADSRGAW